MSVAEDNIKAEQRARTRRNQQRCRERKRAHIEELKNQVDALQAKIRQCEPCPASCPPEHESALDAALRENAALRDLLSALGFDEDAQQRFIASDAKRQMVRTILAEDEGADSSPQVAGDTHAEAPAVSLQPPDMLSAVSANSSVSANGSVSKLASLKENFGHLEQDTPMDVDWSRIMMDYEQFGPDLNIDDWLFNDQAFRNSQPSPMEPLVNHLDTTRTDVDSQDLALGTVNGLELRNGPIAKETASEPRKDNAHFDVRPIAEPPIDRAVDRCFLDTVIQTQAGETATICSTALSMIFRHNRKGLSMAELQRRLKPGIIIPSDTSEECRVENSVMFRVLADISG